MKKITFRTMLFFTGLSWLASCCNGQTTDKTKTKATTNKPATCSHCGKTSCDKSCSSNTASTKNTTLPSCSLDEKEFAERADTLSKTIFSKAKSITSFKNGYDIVFQEPKEFSLSLVDMVNLERTCCSGFTWALIFDPNNTATHLQVYGSKKVKAEMRNAFKSFGIGHLIK